MRQYAYVSSKASIFAQWLTKENLGFQQSHQHQGSSKGHFRTTFTTWKCEMAGRSLRRRQYNPMICGHRDSICITDVECVFQSKWQSRSLEKGIWERGPDVNPQWLLQWCSSILQDQKKTSTQPNARQEQSKSQLHPVRQKNTQQYSTDRKLSKRENKRAASEPPQRLHKV